MNPKIPKFKKKDVSVYEHLDFILRYTTYADRWQWLVEANAFIRAAGKVKIIKPKVK